MWWYVDKLLAGAVRVLQVGGGKERAVGGAWLDRYLWLGNGRRLDLERHAHLTLVKGVPPDLCQDLGRHHQQPHMLTPRQPKARPSGRGAQTRPMSLVGIAPVADAVLRDVTRRLLPHHNHGIWY
jgi:hypothetical protein